MEKPTKFKTVRTDALIKVDIGAGFYERMKQLLMWYHGENDSEKLIKALEELKSREPKDEKEYHLVTIISLIAEIELKAAQQGLLEEKEITSL